MQKSDPIFMFHKLDNVHEKFNRIKTEVDQAESMLLESAYCRVISKDIFVLLTTNY